MIRLAKPSDIEQSVELGRQMYQQSIYSKYPWDNEKATNMALRYGKDSDKLFLVKEHEDRITGFLLANIGYHFYGPAKVAYEQLFYIHPMHRGGSTAVRMMKKLEHWARFQECDLICFGQSAEGVDDRWNKFCQNLGYSPVGTTFFKDL
jgi:GNAT superfamily N-acetyltransferase